MSTLQKPNERMNNSIAEQEQLESVSLSPEDQVRMSRLNEEIQSRLMEMTLITARTLGQPAPDKPWISVLPNSRETETSISAELVVNQIRGCYDYEKGICYIC